MISRPDPETACCRQDPAQLLPGIPENRLVWQDVFGNRNPVEIEIGCGKGRFLLRSAAEHPGRNYLGIEKASRFFRITHKRAVSAGLSNIRLYRGEADLFIRTCVPAASVSAFHILFPDPWPKKRHRKRRLVTTDFMRLLHGCLETGGSVRVATDFHDYFLQMLDAGRRTDGFAGLYCRTETPDSADPEKADTNYERKYLLQGLTIFKAAFKKQ